MTYSLLSVDSMWDKFLIDVESMFYKYFVIICSLPLELLYLSFTNNQIIKEDSFEIQTQTLRLLCFHCPSFSVFHSFVPYCHQYHQYRRKDRLAFPAVENNKIHLILGTTSVHCCPHAWDIRPLCLITICSLSNGAYA